MKPSHRTQPFRRGSGREAGPALSAMLRGRSAFGQNPQDLHRHMQKRRRHRHARRFY
jgi:hypothetical protein